MAESSIMSENIKELAKRVATEFNTQSTKLSTVESTANTAKSIAQAAFPQTGGTVSGDLTVSGKLTGTLQGNASTATKLASAGKITLAGDTSGSVSFDGSDATLTVTVADDSHNHVIDNVDGLQTALNAKAPLASPALTGTPTAPTATAGTNTTQIATTAFVTTAVANKTSVASATKATQDGSGNVITTTYATKTEVTDAIDTAKSSAIDTAKSYADTAVANLVNSAPEALDTLGELATALQENEEVVEALNSAIGNKANDSDVVKLTGDQTIAGTKTFSSTISGSISGNAATATKLASAGTITLAGDCAGSVAFDGSDATLTVTIGDNSHAHIISNVSGLQTALNAKAPLASPALTGTPTAPTAAAGTNTTQVATTAFVTTAIANKTSVDSATKATQDASGNVITSTYTTKTELGNDSFVGKIEMFYGTLDSTGKYPLVGGVTKTNWQICDGTNGTPDLRDKFVVGAGSSYASGSTGGSAGTTTVDKESFDYSMSTSNVSTAMELQTDLPPYVALYYIMKIA